jgi:DNA-binding MarR family transcriptional regulator
MKDIFASGPGENPGYLVSRVYAVRLKRMNAALAPLGVNYVQAGLLMGLYWMAMRGERVNQMMLIHNTRLDKSVVSNILRDLTLAGYVSRAECPTDTRAKIVTLTARGEELTRRVAETINRVDESFWGDAPQEDVCRFLGEVLMRNSEEDVADS